MGLLGRPLAAGVGAELRLTIVIDHEAAALFRDFTQTPAAPHPLPSNPSQTPSYLPLALHLRILYSIPIVEATGGIDERDHFAADGRIRSALKRRKHLTAWLPRAEPRRAALRRGFLARRRRSRAPYAHALRLRPQRQQLPRGKSLQDARLGRNARRRAKKAARAIHGPPRQQARR